MRKQRCLGLRAHGRVKHAHIARLSPAEMRDDPASFWKQREHGSMFDGDFARAEHFQVPGLPVDLRIKGQNLQIRGEGS